MINRLTRNFSLDKTYLDCADNDGNCFIFYSATLKWLFFKIHYAAFIFSDQYNQLTEKSAFRKIKIDSDNRNLNFTDKRFSIRGNWEKITASVETILYCNQVGIVNWCCHHPMAYCTVQYKDQFYTGLGYAETLLLSLKPWELPIDELRWGRFLAPGIAVTWIQWSGEKVINKIYLNGKELNDAVHPMESIHFGEGKNKLAFSNISMIRQVKVGDHLSRVPLLKLLMNKAMLLSTETKYKAATEFTDAVGTIHQGWSIFEIVKWEH